MKKVFGNEKLGAFIGILLGVSVLAFLVSFNYLNPLDILKFNQKNAMESETSVKYETLGDRLKGSTPFTIGDNQQFVVAPLGVDVTEHYLVDTKFVSEVDKDVPVQKEKGVEYKIVTMAIDDNFVRKEYDVYQAVEEYKKGAKVYEVVDALTYGGQDLAIITLVKDDAKKVLDEYVAMDLSNGQVQSLPQELLNHYTSPEYQNKSPMEGYYDYYQEPFSQTTLNSLLTDYNLYSWFSVFYQKSESSRVDSNASKSLNLFTEYGSQSLWDRVYGEPAYAIYPRPESVTVEEWFNTSLHWFAPAGGEDLTVYAISNGQATDYPIRSYADYEAWKATQSGE